MEEMMEILADVLKGVHKIHLNGMTHNNLKSYNIFWNGTHVLLGFPAFDSIFKPQEKCNEKHELKRNDVLAYAGFLSECMKGL
jgi:RIO-like serine/threonine protein kinase